MQNYIDKQDSIFVAGHNGMVGQAIIRELKKLRLLGKTEQKDFYFLVAVVSTQKTLNYQ